MTYQSNHIAPSVTISLDYYNTLKEAQSKLDALYRDKEISELWVYDNRTGRSELRMTSSIGSHYFEQIESIKEAIHQIYKVIPKTTVFNLIPYSEWIKKRSEVISIIETIKELP